VLSELLVSILLCPLPWDRRCPKSWLNVQYISQDRQPTTSICLFIRNLASYLLNTYWFFYALHVIKPTLYSTVFSDSCANSSKRLRFTFLHSHHHHHHLFKQNEQTMWYKQNKYNIGLDAKVHVGLFNRLHVTHKIILKLKWFTIT